ncbi:MAG: hypothetical protein VX178_04820, partial [Pseudomonadota bacterium]|nr:hypothetical protein [Pseudomonadota bacterium]
DRDFDIGFFGFSGDCCFAHVRVLAFRSQDYIAWPKVYYFIKNGAFYQERRLDASCCVITRGVVLCVKTLPVICKG